jgi:hypothetical protein
VVALAVVAGFALTGCGEDGVTACELLTDADAEKILGVPTRPGALDDENEGPGTTCAWISEDSTEDPQAPVYGVHISESTGADARSKFEATRDERSPIYVVAPVEGLGDEAFFIVYTEKNDISQKPSLPTLLARTGDRIVRVGVYDSDERPVESDEAKTFERAAAVSAVKELNGSGS